MEVNPGTVSFQDFRDFYRAGVNRINMGVQSFQDKNLKFLGRIHSAAEAEKALENARSAGFDNVGFDLMYGLPGQSVDDWVKDLSRAVSHNPQHLSCYMLSYEKGTLMDRDRRRGRIRPLPDQAVGKLFEITVAFLQDNGIAQYEISNYADAPDTRSRHNQKYWHFDPYLGFGPGAHSFIDPQRFWNHRDIHTYIALLEQGKRPISGKESLNRDQQMIETIYLGLRTTDGIDLTGFEDRFKIGFAETFAGLIEDFTGRGFMTRDLDRCCLTCKGMLMLDSIAERFVTQV
jgi:oxygen-independent coproporphyrinogen-3 oxidase